MQEPSSTELQAALQAAIEASAPDRIAAVFERLALFDGYQIAKRARAYLEALMTESGPGPEADLLERAREITYGAFQASVWDYVQHKGAKADPAFTGDVPGWIDANAAAVAAANLAIMGGTLSGQGIADADMSARLEALVDKKGCELTQRRILRDIWAGVETSIAEVVALDYGADPFSD